MARRAGPLPRSNGDGDKGAISQNSGGGSQDGAAWRLLGVLLDQESTNRLSARTAYNSRRSDFRHFGGVVRKPVRCRGLDAVRGGGNSRRNRLAARGVARRFTRSPATARRGDKAGSGGSRRPRSDWRGAGRGRPRSLPASSAQFTTYSPSSCSLVSANGPSSTIPLPGPRKVRASAVAPSRAAGPSSLFSLSRSCTWSRSVISAASSSGVQDMTSAST